MRLKDKVAVITGASRGIGEAIARGYAREGASLVIASRKQEALDALLPELTAYGIEARAYATHTGDPAQCKTLIEKTVAEFGKVDIVINNAATNPQFGSMMDSQASQWQKIFEVNIMGYFWLCKYAADAMRERKSGGKLINMASVLGIQPHFTMGIYSISKAAVIAMTQTLAQELAPDNIQVNAIAPGIIQTKFAEALWSNEQIHRRLVENTPAGRIGQPEELVGAAIYLASEESSYMTGQVMVVDGGTTLSNIF
ncbi:MAG: glucose 1-dehydrogenase [Anaerolineae bacterium]|nr:glucose 1-dehydrogenase [Anaerolineae bacterium]